jgi:predicted DNA-binding transcriptional regulator AlpA
MIDDDELIPLLELRKLAGGPSKPIDPSTVYRWIKRGALPRPIKVGPGTSRWLRSECRAALAALIEGSRA